MKIKSKFWKFGEESKRLTNAVNVKSIESLIPKKEIFGGCPEYQNVPTKDKKGKIKIFVMNKGNYL